MVFGFFRYWSNNWDVFKKCLRVLRKKTEEKGGSFLNKPLSVSYNGIESEKGGIRK